MYQLLIADDEDEIRNGLSCYFPWDQVGFEVCYLAEDGQQALEYLQGHPVDALLCDINMPILSGLELLQRLDGQDKRPVIVILSGYREFEYARQAIHLGVSEYVLKPTKYTQLMSVFLSVKEKLDRQFAQEEDPGTLGEPTDVIEQVKQYIQHNYATANLDTAARLVHMNFQYLSKLFKQRAGCLFSEYMHVVRMSEAKAMLREPKNRIYEISERVGYTDARNFSRAFHASEGLWPKEYREQLQKHRP